MTTRRNILKGGAGLAAILASGKAPAALVKSMLAARNSIGMKSGGAKIQYDDEVDYLESTGTQWIDTGVIPNGVKSTIDFALTQVKSGQIAGCHNPNNQRYYPLEVSGNPLRFRRVDRFDNGSYVGTADTNRHTSIYYYDGGKASFDGAESQSSNYAISSAIYNCILFGITRGGVFSTDNAIPMKIFGCKMEKDGVVLRDYIPVRFTNELGQSEGAMYDRVSGELDPFRNQGTGAFLWGHDAAAQNGGGV